MGPSYFFNHPLCKCLRGNDIQCSCILFLINLPWGYFSIFSHKSISPMATNPFSASNTSCWSADWIVRQIFLVCFFFYSAMSTYVFFTFTGPFLGKLSFFKSYPQLRFITLKVTNQNQQREKEHGAKSTRNKEHTFKSPLSKKSHRMHLLSPASDCDKTYKVLSTREAH